MLYFNYCITNNYHADKVLQHLFRFDILRNFKLEIFQHKDAQSPLSLCPPRGEGTGRVALPRDLVPRELPESGGAGRGRVENMGLFTCFPLPDASRAGRPRSDCPSALLPLFHVREAVFMGFIADLPPALRPPLLFSFCPFVQNPPPRPPRLRGSAWVLPSRSSAAPPGSGVHGCRGIMEDIGIFGCFPIA